MSPLKPLSDGQRKVLEVLRAGGKRGVTTAELLASPAGSRYSARIGELRAMPGCQIRTECVRAGSYRFTLLSEPSVEGSGGSAKVVSQGAPAPLNGRLFEAEVASDRLGQYDVFDQ